MKVRLPTTVRAAIGALPLIPRRERLPDRVLTVSEVPVDHSNVAAYAAVTGLRYTDAVPLTYPFVLTFPTVMSLLSSFDFPFPAVGAVHVENHIVARLPISVSDVVAVEAHAENLREHRRGLLVDLVSEISLGTEIVWHQVSTFLHQQRTSLSGEPGPEPARAAAPPPPNAVLRITPARIRRYAAVSGDRNPIHISSLGARLFGFPAAIAHGMFSAAAVLANIEGQLPTAVSYSVKFGKPVILPGSPGVYVNRVADGWDVALRNMSEGYPHLTGTVRALP